MIYVTNKELELLKLVGTELRVDADGSIWRIGNKRRFSEEINPCTPKRAEQPDYNKGYLRVQARKITCSAHRLVWVALRGPIPEGLVINHKNGIKTDNHPDNLEVTTQRDNNLHCIRVLHRPAPQGERHGHHKLGDDDVIRMLQLRSEGETIAALSESFQIAPGQVANICNRKAWRHLGGERIQMDCHPKGEQNNKSKLTETDVSDILWRYEQWETIASISRSFPVSEVAIGNVVKRKTWKHLTFI